MIGSVVDALLLLVGLAILGGALAHALLIPAAVIDLRRSKARDRHRLWRRVLASPSAPRVSVLVPVFNEEATILESLQGIRSLTYQNLEIVVVNDGSTDATETTLIEGLDLVEVRSEYEEPFETETVVRLYRSRTDQRLVVAQKLNGGKADALNAALNLASGSLVCAIDGETTVSPDALQKLVVSFVDRSDVVAAGGSLRLSNSSLEPGLTGLRAVFPRSLWAACQAVEYARAGLISMPAWNQLGGNLITTGAFGVFRRSRIIEAGGYLDGSIGEDAELIVRLRRLGYENGHLARVVFIADPVAWTDAPERLSELRRQRNRWYRGLLEVLTRHRGMIFRPRYRSAGLLALPYLLLVEALAPIIEAFGLVVLATAVFAGLVSAEQLAFMAAVYSLGLLVSIAALLLDDVAFGTPKSLAGRLRMVVVATIEHLVFRPLTVWWRLDGLHDWLRGRGDWGTQVRRGMGPKTELPPALPKIRV
ncbi:MAG: cellulose synthase/poly-beta-1,6-N-acetylglucosamine synthase-like glycosyltransferase [Acidimicrobiales bacterium]|jgi:cellulose synthase/poly-beta-1,6-N-acetylglucosamine synthase-like glycosyltransferase